VRLEFAGEMVELDAAPVTRAFLAGLPSRPSAHRVNVVNAFVIAEERRITVTTLYVPWWPRGSGDSHAGDARRWRTDSPQGTVFGIAAGEREGRITEIQRLFASRQPTRAHARYAQSRMSPA